MVLARKSQEVLTQLFLRDFLVVVKSLTLTNMLLSIWRKILKETLEKKGSLKGAASTFEPKCYFYILVYDRKRKS